MSRRRRPLSPPPTGLRLLAALLFAVSGAAALIDQVVWTRWLQLSLGASSYAGVVVLATFMAGLGLGAAFAGRIADRKPGRALLFFAAAEGGIGLWSLLSIPLLTFVLPAGSTALARLFGVSALPLPLRGVLAAAALLVPTMLMGATLPLLARWAVDLFHKPGRDIGLLYALNTLGGAAGALGAAFLLVESLGLSGSVALAGVADIAVAVVAWRLSRRAIPAVEQREETAPPEADSGTRPFAGAVLAFACSGFAGLALEVLLYRILAVVAGSSAYAFATMLAGFLVGIALGSLIGSALADRSRAPGAWLALALASLAPGAALVRYAFARGAYARIGEALAGEGYGAELVGALVCLLPVTLLLGLVVPWVARLAAAAPKRLARRFGLAYAANTLGAVCGALGGGLLLLPRLGSAGALDAIAALAGLVALVVAWLAAPRPRRAVFAAAALVIAALGALAGHGTDPVRHRLLGRYPAESVLAYREGPVQTIAVVAERNVHQLDFLRLVTNQTSLTGTHLYAKRYMRLLGHLPALHARTPRRALVICLGTGMTAAAVRTHPEVEHLDIAEISPEVVEVAEHFTPLTGPLLEDAGTRLLVDDGRHVLLASAEPWDLITLEPPPPRDSGVVSLYTTEFYRLCQKRLTPGGVVAQWIPLHSQSAEEVQMLIRSFLDAFPAVIGYLPVERELLLIGAAEDARLDTRSLAARMAPPAVRASLAEIGLEEPAALLATALFDRARLERIAGDAGAVTDDRPQVEYFRRHGRRPLGPDPRPWLGDTTTLGSLLRGPVPDALPEAFARDREALVAALRAALSIETREEGARASQAAAALALRPDDPYYLWSQGLSDAHLVQLRQRAERTATAAGWRELAYRLRQRGRAPEAAEAYRAALAVDADDVETLLQFGDLLLQELRQPREGLALLERVLTLQPGHPAAPAIRRMLDRARSRPRP